MAMFIDLTLFFIAFTLLLTPASSKALCTGCTADATIFGQASYLNVYASGNINLEGSDAAGAIAAGGDITVQNDFTADNNNGATSFSVVAAGKLTIGGALSVTKGNVVTGSRSGTIYFNGAGSAVTASASSLPIDFSTTSSYLRSLSSFWGTVAPTGTCSTSYGTTICTCSNSEYQIFSVSASVVFGSSSFSIGFSHCSADQPIIINVSGTSATIQNGEIASGSVAPSQVIFNFPSATALTISSAQFGSAILAPNAAVSGANSQVGQIFCSSLTGNPSFEFHSSINGVPVWFDGCTITEVPPTTPTQAPTTPAPTTASPTTVRVTTQAPTTHAPTTAAPTTTVAVTTHAPTTAAPTTTVAPTTVAPTTAAPTTTVAVTTHAPTTAAPTTTVAPTTVAPTTAAPTTTVAVTTHAPTTAAPTTTVAPTTVAPTTAAPTTTVAPTTRAPTTAAPTTTVAVTTPAPTTVAATTEAPTTTPVHTTVAVTTPAPTTTVAPTTAAPTTTPAQTTVVVTTPAPTTVEATTRAPTTVPVTTPAPTTTVATTPAPATTLPATTAAPTTQPAPQGGCANMTCNVGTDSCCDDAKLGPTCYDSSIASCPTGSEGPILCGFQEHGPDAACGFFCYDNVEYVCCDNQIYGLDEDNIPCAPSMDNITLPAPVICGNTACDSAGYVCCNDVVHGPTCYWPTDSSCPSGVNGSVLCGVNDGVCGLVCYNLNAYSCDQTSDAPTLVPLSSQAVQDDAKVNSAFLLAPAGFVAALFTVAVSLLIHF